MENIYLSYLLLPWGDNITKATYKSKHLIGDLPTVSQGEAMTIMVSNMAEGKQSIEPLRGIGKGETKPDVRLLKLQSLPAMEHILQQCQTQFSWENGCPKDICVKFMVS